MSDGGNAILDVAALRELLAFSYSGASLCRDGGELQDSRELPLIDFLRDSPEEIRDKMQQRAENAMRRGDVDTVSNGWTPIAEGAFQPGDEVFVSDGGTCILAMWDDLGDPEYPYMGWNYGAVTVDNTNFTPTHFRPYEFEDVPE